MKTTKHLALLSMFTGISLIIFVIESAIPPLVPIPGIKLGLSNIITLILLLHWNYKSALTVLIMRIILASIFMGHPMIFLYSLTGGLLSLTAMAIINRILNKKLIWFTSIMGGITHNIGQIIIAIIILQTREIIYYLPFLIVSGIITGLFVGLCSDLLSKRLKSIIGTSFK